VIALAKMGPAGQEAAEPLKLLAHEDGDARVREYAAKALEKLETAKQVP
jgi:HEAT repeat protein